jgi:NAD(P)H-hydrate repair Nnr-like enzyme with NAD(P)H-hydrate dehydratase domain
MLVRSTGNKRAEDVKTEPITELWATDHMPRREPGAHKWSVGGVIVVAGSPPFAGAAVLCCAAAGRSGAGIVSAALSRSVAAVVVGLVPEVTVIILPEGDSASVAARSVSLIEERLKQSKSLVVGPGLGDDEATSILLGMLFGFRRLRGEIGFGSIGSHGERATDGVISQAGKPVVVDADALNWLASQPEWWEKVPEGQLVLTPHPGEMSRLMGIDAKEIVANPAEYAQRCASTWRQTVVLKGRETLIAAPGEPILATETPTSLASAGTGDVLSGSIGAFLAQGLSPRDSAALAVFVGNRAAARVASRVGSLGLVASDLPFAVAEELCSLEGKGG